MHKVIYLIVEANTEKDAWGKTDILRNLLTDKINQYYDYGMFFNEESSVAGKSRWGAMTPIARLDTKEGKQLLNWGLDSIRRQFLEALKDIKDTLELYTEKEIYDGEITDPKSKIIENLRDDKDKRFLLSMFRYRALNLCDNLHYGWVYILRNYQKQNWIEEVEGHNSFKLIFKGKDKSKFWIAPMDVHF